MKKENLSGWCYLAAKALKEVTGWCLLGSGNVTRLPVTLESWDWSCSGSSTVMLHQDVQHSPAMGSTPGEAARTGVGRNSDHQWWNNKRKELQCIKTLLCNQGMCLLAEKCAEGCLYLVKPQLSVLALSCCLCSGRVSIFQRLFDHVN